MNNVRVRFAPSPTGTLHIGGVRTALFNYLFAKKNNGSFILRIEDTDKERSKKEYEKVIFEGLKWAGLDWQEGPDKEGSFGPYRQSERTDIYKEYIEKLISENKAYYCFCTKEEIEAQKQYLASIGKNQIYSGKCRSLKKEEIEKNLKMGKPYVIRLKTIIKKVKFKDLLRGSIEYDTEVFGDFVIAKNETEPLYNLACVIDDSLMEISHVIRGEDHISNTPRQILLYEALGKEIPQFLHLPLILGKDKRKMSKREGSVSIKEYKEEGYLPKALINFLALLGWNPKNNQEIFSMKDLIEEFSCDKIQKSGAIFNINKLDWINSHYIKKEPIEELTRLCVPFLIKKGLIIPIIENKEYKAKETGETISFNFLVKAVKMHQERIKKLSEIGELADFLFINIKYEKELLRWKEMKDKEIKSSLSKSYKILKNTKEWKEEEITRTLLEEAGENRGELLWPLRVALSGKKSSASPFEIAGALGKEKTLLKIKEAKEKL